MVTVDLSELEPGDVIELRNGERHTVISVELLDAEWFQVETEYPRVGRRNEDKFSSVRIHLKDGRWGEGLEFPGDIMKAIKQSDSSANDTAAKPQQSESDEVNHPSHYTSGKIEVIDFIEDQGLGFCLGNAVKYVSRAGKKDPTKKIQDLKKAVWFLQRQIKKWEEA